MDQNNALSVFLTTITSLIENGDLDSALEALRKMENEFQIGLGQDITLQLGTYNRIKKMRQQGIVDDGTFLRQVSQTQYNVTELLKEAPRKLDMNARLKGLSSASGISIATDKIEFEKLISSEGLVKINWLEKAITASKSVCRVIFKDGRAAGTGFLTDGNYLFTNNHVIDSADKAKGMLAQFNFEFGADNQMRETVQYEFDTSDFFTSPQNQLDCTRIKLKDRNDKPLSRWGVLTLAPQSVPTLRQPVNIIQHPNGRDKEIALRANEVTNIEGHLIRYLTNTEGGSSGSPVFNQNWEVVALHHGYKATLNANEGILFRDIFHVLAGNPFNNTTAGTGSRGAAPEAAPESVAQSAPPAPVTPVVSTPAKTARFLILYDVADESYNETLRDFLTPYVRNKKIEVRSLHQDAGAGDPLVFAQSEKIQADYILCLITRKFNVSEWLDFALTAAKDGKKIVPIRVTSVDIAGTGLERFSALPTQGRTVPAFKDDDAAYSDIVKALARYFQ